MKSLPNTPEIKLGLVGVSRDCFPLALSKKRLAAVAGCCEKQGLNFHAVGTIIETEKDLAPVLKELSDCGANALAIYLGNFGPEGPASKLAQAFSGPVMACAAAEETGSDLINGRGDAFCGMLNLSYNLGLRKLNVHIPERPVGLPEETAIAIRDFVPVARILVGLKNLKVFAFGPRPQDFLACNAPVKPLYDLGIEVMENSELDLKVLFDSQANNSRIEQISKEMAAELGGGNTYPDLLPKLARFEATLEQFLKENLGASKYAVFANKCWPTFEGAFHFVPCYVNSRLAGRGIPTACEVDIYGALSEYMAQLASTHPATLLDINNTVPADLLGNTNLKGARREDLFMGFHCGNTPKSCMKSCSLKYQLIMHRLMEGSKQPDITRGTLEGQLKPGPATIVRLQATAACELKSYLAEGEILDLDCKSFGGIGTFAIPNFSRFYRHVLIGKRFPHHSAVAFDHSGQTLYAALTMLGVPDIATPHNAALPYEQENPFAAKNTGK